MTIYLVFTRDSCRVVKRRPYPVPGEWIVQLHVTFPPPTTVPVMSIDLPAELPLERAEAVVPGRPEPEGDEPL